MRHIIHGSARGIDAVREVIADLSLPPHRSSCAEFFPQGRDVLVTRAPGTLRLFGGAADAVGARALHVASAEGAIVALQRDPRGLLTVVRRLPGPGGRADIFEMPMHFLLSDGRPVRYDVARHYFARHDDRAWAAPFAGAFLALMRDRRMRFGEGVRVLVAAAAPSGHGRASTEAAVIALLRGLFAELNLVADPRELTRLAAHADHGVHGALDIVNDHWPISRWCRGRRASRSSASTSAAPPTSPTAGSTAFAWQWRWPPA
jgi:galactokinase